MMFEPVRILLVDDRPKNLVALRAILDDAAYQLVSAASGEEALAAALTYDFAVVLMDVAMPGMDGFETATMLRQRPGCSALPIIFITASLHDVEEIYRGYTVGGVDYLHKPVAAVVVRAKVAVFVELYRQRQQIQQQGEALCLAERREHELLMLRAQAALQASEARYEATSRAAPFGMAILNGQGQWLRVNATLCTLLGYSRSNLPVLRQLLVPAWGQADGSAAMAPVNDVLQPHSGSLRLRCRDGHALWAQANLTCLPSDGDEPQRYILLVEDIGERRRQALWGELLSGASAALLGSLNWRETLQAVVQLAVERVSGGCSIELDGVDGAEASLHACREPSAAAPLAELMALLRPCRVEAAPRLTLGSDWLTRAGAELSPAVAALLPRQLIRVPMLAHGQVLGWMSLSAAAGETLWHGCDLEMARDLACRCALALDNAQLYHRAQEAIEARDEFLLLASHELRTPLTPLRIQLQRLRGRVSRQARPLSQERRDELLERSEGNVLQLDRLIQQLLDVSRITTGQLRLTCESLDLMTLIDEVAGRFKEVLTHAGSQLSVEASTPIVGEWDRIRLEQVVTNLLTNAVKYGAGQPIVVRAVVAGDHTRLEVRDGGIGIAPEKQDRIFERFGRAVHSSAFSGLGLGLYITRQIVEAHGGAIEVDSSPNQGSLFVVRLPNLAVRGAVQAQDVDQS